MSITKKIISFLLNLSPKKRDFFLFALFMLGIVFYLFITNNPVKKIPVIAPPPRLISTLPSFQGEQYFHFPDEALAFTFDQTIFLTHLQVQSIPTTYLRPKISDDAKTLILIPEKPWVYNTKYQIQISGITPETIFFVFTPLQPDYSKPMGVPVENLSP